MPSSLPSTVAATSAKQDTIISELQALNVKYLKKIDEASATITYIGEAAIGSADGSAVWRISKIDFNNPTSIKWAGGGAFNQIWTNRVGLTYA